MRGFSKAFVIGLGVYLGSLLTSAPAPAAYQSGVEVKTYATKTLPEKFRCLVLKSDFIEGTCCASEKRTGKGLPREIFYDLENDLGLNFNFENEDSGKQKILVINPELPPGGTAEMKTELFDMYSGEPIGSFSALNVSPENEEAKRKQDKYREIVRDAGIPWALKKINEASSGETRPPQ